MEMFSGNKKRCNRLFVSALLAVFLAISPAPVQASWSSMFGKIFRKNKEPSREISFSCLSLRDAVQLALRNHLVTRLALEEIREAKGKRLQAASVLLPHVEGVLSEKRVGRINYGVMGFRGQPLGGAFDDFEARFMLTQKVFDLSAFSRFLAGNAEVKVKQCEEEFARQKVTLMASFAYLAALQSKGKLEAAEANATLADRLLEQAEHQHEVQIATGVDVARATTRQAEELFSLDESRMHVTESYLELQRVTGIPFAEALSLSDSLDYFDPAAISFETAMEIAGENRLEIRTLDEAIRAQNHLVRAAKAEMLPKGELTGDYGLSGNGPRHNDRATGQVMIGMSMPIFEGGKILGSIREAASQKRQLERQLEDVKKQIEKDIRVALLKIKTESQQVQTARSILSFAERELKMARDRFASGIGDNVEVVNAQTVTARARDTLIAALTAYHVARLNLDAACGRPGDFYLQGNVMNREEKDHA